ncbi:hypothetical protein J7E71_22805 [Mesobacillus foraminis]|uniref:hypothetical protein n=1 Tax=Mesobacillus foraminis TaxID=279826 RepID=UPI001BE8CEED|nr:hypothetical protein [Mesobacillus foraminis]MBT2758707.1 hypothetical protein [Mesobacillus foraminis]
MKNGREIELAERIIQLDLLRDELYEELLKTFGSRTHEFLRAVQNRPKSPTERSPQPKALTR